MKAWSFEIPQRLELEASDLGILPRCDHKIVLQALASHLNDLGDPMFPSQERRARLCSLSERAIIQHLQVAEEAGWISPRKRRLKGNKWASNEYAACFPSWVNESHPWGE